MTVYVFWIVHGDETQVVSVTTTIEHAMRQGKSVLRIHGREALEWKSDPNGTQWWMKEPGTNRVLNIAAYELDGAYSVVL